MNTLLVDEDRKNKVIYYRTKSKHGEYRIINKDIDMEYLNNFFNSLEERDD